MKKNPSRSIIYIIAIPAITILLIGIVTVAFKTDKVGLPGENVEMDAMWVKDEAHYFPREILVGQTLHEDRGVIEVRITKLEIIENTWGDIWEKTNGVLRAKLDGIILKGEVTVGMSLYLETLDDIPERSIPSIVVTKVKK